MSSFFFHLPHMTLCAVGRFLCCHLLYLSTYLTLYTITSLFLAVSITYISLVCRVRLNRFNVLRIEKFRPDSGADTGFKWGGARFISEQKNPDLGTKRHAFFKIDIFPVLHEVFYPLCAIEKLFWNLRGRLRPPPWIRQGVRRSCRPLLYPPLASTWKIP